MRLIPVLAVLLGGSVAAAAPYTRRCAEKSPDLPAAKARLARLHDMVAKAAPDAPVAPLVKELEALLAAPCFQLAEALGQPVLDGATTLALRQWWNDGGREWLASQLDPKPEHVTFPPTLRKTLTLESSPKHPLARLLCKANDVTCGRETAGWIVRAENAFRDAARANAKWPGMGYTVNLYSRSSPPKEADETPRNQTLNVPLWQCAFPGGKKQQDFDAWQSCVSALRIPNAAFPVGTFRAPTSGWFVIRGRRGHYNFCDGLAAFDLATGAYYASKSCSGLALRSDGSVDGQTTDAARTPGIETGRVSVDNLREAAWMMMFAREIEEHAHEDANSFPIPPGLEVKIPAQQRRGGFASSFWVSSAQTQLTWTWIDNAATVAEGTLTWPNSAREAETHAASLLRIAEAGVIAGCPPAPLPNPIVKGCGKGGVSSIDSSAASLCAVQTQLTAQLASFRCTKP